MPRASWKGFLRLSLVSCPIYLSPASTRTKSIRLHQVWQPRASGGVGPRTMKRRGRRPRPADAPFSEDSGKVDAAEPPAPTRVALLPARPVHRRGDRPRGGRQGLRSRARPVRHLHRRRAQGARRGKLEDHRPRNLRAARRGRPGVFQHAVLRLSGRPDRGGDVPRDRGGNGRGRGRRDRPRYLKPPRAPRHGRAARRGHGADHLAGRGGGEGGRFRQMRRAISTPTWWRSPRRSSSAAAEASIPPPSGTATRRRCASSLRRR